MVLEGRRSLRLKSLCYEIDKLELVANRLLR